ncbi:MAG: restriction endonuclease [Candidatus Omnitrophica bacterium]|nr:restriction endonuclease [Candidatus Omnitrophota bacterium]
MKLAFNKQIAQSYHSVSQKIRVMAEDWVSREIFCPACGCNIKHYENNRPVADFFCLDCKEEFELKSKKDSIGNKIVDGAYRTMIERLQSNNNPNFFFLNYHLRSFEAINFFVIPKHFFVPQIIEKRKPLALSARRAGWIGCNILLQRIPVSGRIFLVKNAHVESKQKVLRDWKKTLFLREEKDIKSKGWIIDVMNCIEQLAKKEFTLDEVYNFEAVLQTKHQSNRHIKDKIRQQLQVLRDKGYLEFVRKGQYRVIK